MEVDDDGTGTDDLWLVRKLALFAGEPGVADEVGVVNQDDAAGHEVNDEDDEEAASSPFERSRIAAGKVLWDYSVSEPHATQLLRLPTLDAVASVMLQTVGSDPGNGITPMADTLGTPASEAAPAASIAVAARLQEIALGICGNICTHASLRPAFLSSAAVGPTLGVFLLTTDAGSLTEALRLFSAMAASDSAVFWTAWTGDGSDVFLGKLCFILQNALDFPLLARGCELLFQLVYHSVTIAGNDEGSRSETETAAWRLVHVHGVDAALAALLSDAGVRDGLDNVRIGHETGLGYLLRALEVLCASGVFASDTTGAVPATCDEAETVTATAIPVATAAGTAAPASPPAAAGQEDDSHTPTWLAIARGTAALFQPFEPPGRTQENAVVVLANCLQTPEHVACLLKAEAASGTGHASTDSPGHNYDDGGGGATALSIRDLIESVAALCAAMAGADAPASKAGETEAAAAVLEVIAAHLQKREVDGAASAASVRKALGLLETCILQLQSVEGAGSAAGALLRTKARLEQI